jgi:hypothetical protein
MDFSVLPALVSVAETTQIGQEQTVGERYPGAIERPVRTW